MNKRKIQQEILESIESLLNALDFIDDAEETEFTDEVQILIEKMRNKGENNARK